MSAAPPPLAPDLVVALKRLKLSRVRALAPEVLATAKTQRWAPEEVLRTLVEAEIAGRDEANAANRLRVAGFPVTKTLEQFQRAHSSIAAPTLDYLGSLEWISARENLCLVGPAGTGKSHLLVALGHAAIAQGLRVRYLVAADLVETLLRGLADNSVGRVIDGLLRHDLVLVDLCRARGYADTRPGGGARARAEPPTIGIITGPPGRPSACRVAGSGRPCRPAASCGQGRAP